MFDKWKQLDFLHQDTSVLFFDSVRINESWQKSKQLGIKPDQDRPRICLSKQKTLVRIKQNKILLEIAAPLLQESYASLLDKNVLFLLCDKEGYVLELTCSPEVLKMCAELGIRRGTSFSCESAGTNAICLAMQELKTVVVRGEQHYCDFLKSWYCVAVPIYSSYHGIMGFLDISAHIETDLIKMIPLVEMLAKIISREVDRETHVAADKERLKYLELSGREKVVLEYLVAGYSYEAVARKLRISKNTVKTIVRRAYQKLEVKCLQECKEKYSRFLVRYSDE
ncbi:regulatory protein, luxR family [Carboxydocella sporoproducens DSM 16521]|uniref:Regulatory protein, luxR family n=2 Tax=Carboxydocella TaxID=178898 RepID=A0A1T4N994_9FIRM|nr:MULTISPECIES: LuxR C-terminal-related transcriptional regulator [Carboxydocella]AVX20954.1 regulatory protein, luxR family [Carboxydocella thermautotrophica]AVX31368.1 regulatory protein, luxR family [Carboxydocella thermautotrophica]SJZ75799.1 regulatory protein, luxR family [Carboxydocella sporoproducens DSM 16521]